jgi:Tfp pilus assembly protein PilX
VTRVLRRIRQADDERGIALVFALLAMTVLGIAVASVIAFSSSSGRTASMSSSRQSAYNLAEAGIASAMAVLKLPTNNALDPTVFCSSATQPTPCTTVNAYTMGTATWYGVLTASQWTLTSTGQVRNPTGVTAGAIRRTITATVNVHPTLTQPLNTPIWDYIYATQAASPPPTCDMTVSNSVIISSPLYVMGNLCLDQTSSITKGPLIVLGRLNLIKSANIVGSPTSKISDAHILNGCVWKSGAVHTPCQGAVDNVYANTLDATSPTNLSPPTVDYSKWYLNASPGPYFPCQTINGLAPIAGYPAFDGTVAAMTASDTDKLAWKNDSQGIQNLTPAGSYRCQTAAGELSWNAATRKLTIKGTVYIDGSVAIGNGLVNDYDGQGVIYLSGTFRMDGATLCARVLNGTCDNRTPANGGWDPNTELLAIVANGTNGGGQNPVGSTIFLKNGAFQGALYAAGSIDLSTSATAAGPMVGSTVNLSQSTTTSFPTISTVPDGMPANRTAYADPDPPSYSG